MQSEKPKTACQRKPTAPLALSSSVRRDLERPTGHCLHVAMRARSQNTISPTLKRGSLLADRLTHDQEVRGLRVRSGEAELGVNSIVQLVEDVVPARDQH